MPLYDFSCRGCGYEGEHYVSREGEALYCPECCTLLDQLMSAPGAVVFGGAEGKLRSAEKLRKRNEAYHSSSAGRDKHRHAVESAHRKHGIGT